MTTERTPKLGGDEAQRSAQKASPAPTDVGGLKALALAATPGPWSTVVRMGGDAIVDARIRPVARVDYRRDELGRDADAAFIAAANPAAILSLIALLETQASALAEKDAALKEAGEALRDADCALTGTIEDQFDEAVYGPPEDRSEAEELCGHRLCDISGCLRNKRDAARSVLSTINGAGK